MSDVPRTVLVVEDEEAIRRFLRVTLEAQGYRVVEAVNGKEGLLQASTCQADLVILDLGLPDMDGVELTRRLREWMKAPILIVSARGKEQEKVVALDAGADDYLTKPFGVGELLARLRVAMRRVAGGERAEAVFESGDLRVDLARREVRRGGEAVHLTPNEYRLLALLVRYPGRVLTHRQILQEVWGPDSTQETHYLRVYMNQLRQKIEVDPAQPRYLMTEPGVGYRLAGE